MGCPTCVHLGLICCQVFILNTGGMKVADGVIEREGNNIQSKEVEERKDEVRLRKIKTDPTCNPGYLITPFLPLAYSRQSSNPLSRAWKTEKSGSRIPSFNPFVFSFHFQSLPSHLTSTFFFSTRRSSTIEKKKLHHLSCWKRQQCNSIQPFMHAL